MRIALLGQAAFGADVFKVLHPRYEIVGVFCPPDSPKGKVDPLKEAAQAAGVPVLQPRRMKDPEAFEAMKKLAPDLAVLAFVTDIVPGRVLELPRLGSICYHPSLLPKHRGASAINWAVIEGDSKTGLTIFWVDEGIDTGDILLQKEVEIDPDDTTGTLYFNKLYPLGIEAILEAVDLIAAGKAPHIPQDHSKATYEPPCDDRVAEINWSQPGRVVYNFIRGCDPQPGATSTLRGEKVKFFQAKYSPRAHSAAPGEIVAVAPQGLSIAVPEGVITVGRLRTPGLGKVKAEEFIKAMEPKVGEKFGS
ncbi:MAG: methionyl-tRNA formyltransferase [Desulfobacca sp.]|uniref:methionyl-tRNA formyltransferase n=1 Tax=Desulfobacca sp. TaxID=2067990 RepID=UPI0040496CBA